MIDGGRHHRLFVLFQRFGRLGKGGRRSRFGRMLLLNLGWELLGMLHAIHSRLVRDG